MAARRLNAQTPESTLTAQADYVLRNDSSLAHLQAAAEQLCTKLLAEGGAGKEL
jgi:dephospho-CoA kinase